MNDLVTLAKQLSSEDEAERIYAAEDIGQLNSPDGVAILVERLEHEERRAVKEAIMTALESMDGDRPLTAAASLLESEDPFIRNRATLLFERSGARAVPVLEAAFNSPSERVRKMVLDAVANLTSGDFAPLYERALMDTDVNVVITAVEQIGARHLLPFRAALLRQLSETQEPLLQVACIEALATVGDESTLQQMLKRFGGVEGAPEIQRSFLLQAIGALGGDDAQTILIEVLNNGAKRHGDAVAALRTLASRHKWRSLPAPLVHALLRELRTASNAERAPIMCLLELAIKEPEAQQLLKEQLSETDDATTRQLIAGLLSGKDA